jgi:hypothetical protein
VHSRKREELPLCYDVRRSRHAAHHVYPAVNAEKQVTGGLGVTYLSCGGSRRGAAFLQQISLSKAPLIGSARSKIGVSPWYEQAVVPRL